MKFEMSCLNPNCNSVILAEKPELCKMCQDAENDKYAVPEGYKV